MNFEAARQVADAVLYEGYVLYPYRASSPKNRVRWQFGVLAPKGVSEAGGFEPWAMQTECLVEPGRDPVLDLRVRSLQVQLRSVEEASAETGEFRRVERLVAGGQQYVSWEEGLERHWDATGIALRELVDTERVLHREMPGGRETETLSGVGGVTLGRIVRECWLISGVLRLSAEAAGPLLKVRVRVENQTPWGEGVPADRDLGRRLSLAGVHTLLAVRDGAFVSLLEPPPEAASAAAACRNEHTWPVLVGKEGQRDLMLSSPIILYDYPAVAPESPGDLCDATEIDEILTLRILTLTDEEKAEARATDERARRIIDRSDLLPPEVFERLHGAIQSVPSGPPVKKERWEDFLNPTPEASSEEASVRVGDCLVAKGSRVRLAPRRRADSMDFFLAGRPAVVQAVLRDVDGETHVAVTVEDDPASDLHGWYGRFFYFHPEELEPLGPDGEETDGPERKA